jgi:TRAP-type C4-dicarboxylate transport system permease small subunit
MRAICTRRFVITSGICLYWFLFFLFFGYFHWGEFELFDKQWWFDSFGHALFGISASINLLYLYRRRACHGAFNFTGHVFLAVNIVGQVLIVGGVLWEGVEAAWDQIIQPWCCPLAAQAQKGALDTTLDIVITSFASAITIGVWLAYNKMYARLFPNESLEMLLEETLEHIEYMGETIRRSHVENLKLREIRKRLYGAIRKARHRLQEKRKK